MTTTTDGLRVVVAEDSALMRAGLCRLLLDSGLDVVAAVDDLDALLEAVARYLPDVVITDIRMPPTGTDEGLRAAEQIHRSHPQIGVVVLSQFVESRSALKLMTSNPRGIGYLLKDHVSDVSELVSTIQRVARGECAVDRDIVHQLLEKKRAGDPMQRLTDREREILELVATGRSNSAICQLLFLGQKTVETHVRRIFAKLDLEATPDDNRRVLAVLTYLRGA